MSAWRSVVTVSAVFAVAGAVRWVVAEPYLLAGRSMHPTFRSHDWLIVEKVSGRLGSYGRGEVILFREPSSAARGLKRIVGLPGETVQVTPEGLVVRSGAKIVWEMRFDAERAPAGAEEVRFAWVDLGEGEYFVLGDHFGVSIDSRHFGPVKKTAIIGKEFLRLYPDPQFRPGRQR